MSPEEYTYGTPSDGDDVIIPCEWTMLLDTPTVTFGTLIIDGALKIDPSLAEVVINATNIWVRGGKLIAGTAE